jgi:hypothetical protein
MSKAISVAEDKGARNLTIRTPDNGWNSSFDQIPTLTALNINDLVLFLSHGYENACIFLLH